MNTSRQSKNNHWIRKIDWILVGIIILLAIISITFINSAMGAANTAPILVYVKYYIMFLEQSLHV
ncbi:hypothetical protein AABC03_10355 [Staphylococcus nepalensis]